MTPEQLNQIADLIAKSLEDWVPEAVDAAVEARLKELNLSENADIKEIKSQLKELVEKAKFWSSLWHMIEFKWLLKKLVQYFLLLMN